MTPLNFPAVDPLTGAEDKDLAAPSWSWRSIFLISIPGIIFWVFIGWLVWTHL